MKRGSRKNNWPPWVYSLFFEDNFWNCWGCGCNHANCGHHIFGRGKAEGCEKSIFNFAPMGNFECHLPHHGKWTTDEGKKELLEKTIKYLSDIEYELKPIDIEFLAKYDSEFKRLKIKI